jgi:hypothetical protein
MIYVSYAKLFFCLEASQILFPTTTKLLRTQFSFHRKNIFFLVIIHASKNWNFCCESRHSIDYGILLHSTFWIINSGIIENESLQILCSLERAKVCAGTFGLRPKCLYEMSANSDASFLISVTAEPWLSPQSIGRSSARMHCIILRQSVAKMMWLKPYSLVTLRIA